MENGGSSLNNYHSSEQQCHLELISDEGQSFNSDYETEVVSITDREILGEKI